MTQRFHVDAFPERGEILVRGPEAHHLARVRRIQVGEEITLFDGRGRVVRGIVRAIRKDDVLVSHEEELDVEPGPAVPIRLATAVPKGERFDWLIEKATELGVTELIPLRTEHSVVDPGPSKLDRLRRHIVEASKQSGRSWLMVLAEPAEFKQLLMSPPDQEWRLLAHPSGRALADAMPRPLPGSVLVAIGPEAGFSNSEAAAAGEAGWSPVRLGGTILRIETAGLALAAAITALVESGAE